MEIQAPKVVKISNFKRNHEQKRVVRSSTGTRKVGQVMRATDRTIILRHFRLEVRINKTSEARLQPWWVRPWRPIRAE